MRRPSRLQQPAVQRPDNHPVYDKAHGREAYDYQRQHAYQAPAVKTLLGLHWQMMTKAGQFGHVASGKVLSLTPPGAFQIMARPANPVHP